MYPFVAIIDDSLILEWEANRTDSAINETPAVIQRRVLLMDGICICSQRGTGQEGLVKISKVVGHVRCKSSLEQHWSSCSFLRPVCQIVE